MWPDYQSPWSCNNKQTKITQNIKQKNYYIAIHSINPFMAPTVENNFNIFFLYHVCLPTQSSISLLRIAQCPLTTLMFLFVWTSNIFCIYSHLFAHPVCSSQSISALNGFMTISRLELRQQIPIVPSQVSFRTVLVSHNGLFSVLFYSQYTKTK